MNRLYWLNDDLHWEMVAENEDENALMMQAEGRMQGSMYGTCGYAKFINAPEHLYWTAYVRYQGGCKRVARPASMIPKAIQLMELFHD